MPTIYAVGRNYAAHAREMGVRPLEGGEPVVFLKPWSARVASGGTLAFPPGIGEVHHEVELVARVGDGGRADALAVGLDLTDRTRQAAAKQAGLPWAAAKGFRGSAAVGPFLPVASLPALGSLIFTLHVNGHLRQRGQASDMLHPVPALLAYLDAWFGLAPGDLVFTGTPEGVAAVHPGDRLDLALEGHPAAGATFVVSAEGSGTT